MSLITETRTRLVSTATYGCSDRTPGIQIRYPISAVDPADTCLNKKHPRREEMHDSTYFLISHTFSLLSPSLRLAHHSARCRIHASRLCSGCRPLMLMQNLTSFHFAEQCAISPKRYIDLS